VWWRAWELWSSGSSQGLALDAEAETLAAELAVLLADLPRDIRQELVEGIERALRAARKAYPYQARPLGRSGENAGAEEAGDELASAAAALIDQFSSAVVLL
jgi:hypothetical protein